MTRVQPKQEYYLVSNTTLINKSSGPISGQVFTFFTNHIVILMQNYSKYIFRTIKQGLPEQQTLEENSHNQVFSFYLDNFSVR